MIKIKMYTIIAIFVMLFCLGCSNNSVLSGLAEQEMSGQIYSLTEGPILEIPGAQEALESILAEIEKGNMDYGVPPSPESRDLTLSLSQNPGQIPANPIIVPMDATVPLIGISDPGHIYHWKLYKDGVYVELPDEIETTYMTLTDIGNEMEINIDKDFKGSGEYELQCEIIIVISISQYLFFTRNLLSNKVFIEFIDKPAPVYELRDTGPAGGLIFYDKGEESDGWRYLEAAPMDILNNYNQSKNLYWALGNCGTTGASGTAPGTGRSNTNFITQFYSNTYYAAHDCSYYVINGFDDWFLPSKDELNMMYVNLKSYGLGNFRPEGYYWSSSEASACEVWYQRFNSGLQYTNLKTNPYFVRAVRAF